MPAERLNNVFALIVLVGLFGFAGPTLANKYVTPSGAGSFNGADWNNAFSSVQAAVNACSEGETIYLRYGTYVSTASLVISNAPTILIAGGYEGAGSPGNVTNLPSVLTRDTEQNIRIVSGYASTFIMDRITISNGLLAAYNEWGAGLKLVNCTATLRNCVVKGNRNDNVDSAESGSTCGGGIYASGGTLVITNSTIAANYVYAHETAYSGRGYGGGVYSVATVLKVYDSIFTGNYARVNTQLGAWPNGSVAGIYTYGGAISHSGGSVYFSKTIFSDNYVSAEYANRGRHSYGGALYLSGTATADIIGCSFMLNRADSGGDTTYGSALYLENSSINLRNSDIAFNSSLDSVEAVCLFTGSVNVANCLIRENIGQRKNRDRQLVVDGSRACKVLWRQLLRVVEQLFGVVGCGGRKGSGRRKA